MDSEPPSDDGSGLTRRALLAASTGATAMGLSGCAALESLLGDSSGDATPTPAETPTETVDVEIDLEGFSPEEIGPGIDRVEKTPIGDGYHDYVAVLNDGQTFQLDDHVRAQELNERAPDLGDASTPIHRPEEAGVVLTPIEPIDPLTPIEPIDPIPQPDIEQLAADEGDRAAFGSGRYATSTPEQVSLKDHQTPLKNQGGRGTCVDFCIVAAMEARLHRQLGREVNLSEQYANHIEKMVVLEENHIDGQWAENNLGTIGGGGARSQLAILSQYGIPERTDSQRPRYISAGRYGNPTQRGDNPRFNWANNQSATQKTVNDFNLADDRITIQDPQNRQVTPFPQGALEDAKYHVGSYTSIPNNSQLRDPSYFEEKLANDQEVIIELVTSCLTTGQNVWKPQDNAGGCGGGHCILLVGYDRSGDNEYFVAKNSWNSYEKIHYDVFREGKVYGASWIEDVYIHDDSSSFVKPDLFLGRWDLTMDGTDYTLDISRLPHFYDSDDIDAPRDNRIGALFDDQGNMYRVNGELNPLSRIYGNVAYNGEWAALYISVDFDEQYREYHDLLGSNGILYLHPDDPTFLAGNFLPDGESRRRSFYGVKDDMPAGSSQYGPSQPAALLGEWEIRSPVVDGTLRVTDVDEPNTAFTATLVDSRGSTHGFTGRIQGQRVEFTLPASAGGGTFDGYIHTDDPSKLSGTFTRSLTRTGMALVRQAPDSVEIVRPTDGATVSAPIQLEARVVGVSNPGIVWTSNGPYDPGATDAGTIIGRGATASTKLPRGEQTIWATYTLPDGSEVVDTVDVTVN
jgi:hypothetical protein